MTQSKIIVKPLVKGLTIAELKRAAFEGIVVGRVASHTKKGTSYAIRLDVNNCLYCECDGWFWRHVCSHLDEFRAVLIRANAKRPSVKRRRRPK
jgi:hypothetical protein